jgi:hypothetical protein
VFSTYVAVTLVTVAINAAIVAADLAKARFVVANSAEVGVPREALPLLAALKGAGAAGLVLGLLGLDAIGIAAAAGLVAFFICAVAAHVRARVFYNIAFPGAYLALAAASLGLALAN